MFFRGGSMSDDFPIGFGHAFGFITHNQIVKSCLKNGDDLETAVSSAYGSRAIRWLANTATVLGWMPIIGIIVGIVRIIFAYNYLSKSDQFLDKNLSYQTISKRQEFLDGMVFKGLLEIACFSFLLPYIDIPATLIRSMSHIDFPKEKFHV